MAEADLNDWTSQELRAAPCISLMLRAAKLVRPAGEFLCILRDVSATGLKARLFHALPQDGPLALELGTGERHPIEPVWERDRHVGFR
ncbi:MAG: PilZ domain-containing protein, partial [Novosphingobium sp.]